MRQHVGRLVLALVVVLLWPQIGLAAADGGQATLYPPNRAGGASGQGDQRDADIYPAVAYDAASGRYLAVWLTPRNADSSSDGLDVYGVFLNQAGQPVGTEFRISDSEVRGFANTAARSALPAVAAGAGEFVVAWTARGTACQVYAQRVADASARPDRVLASGTGHRHSPSLVYNPARQRYALAYVEGDDYLPPTLFGAQTTDCGNNASSASRVKALDFYLDSGGNPVVGTPRDVSHAGGGAFRPRLAYSAGLNRYLAAWEDRRSAGGQPYRFDVYAQLMDGDLAALGGDLALATGGDYTNYDTSATWTPRPAVAGGDDRFLAAWFTHETQGSAAVWSVTGRLVPGSGTPAPPFTVFQMTFAQPHPERAPTGFLAAAYANGPKEYLVGISSHLESVWGYLSLALVQRASATGQLLKLDGSVRSQPGVGYSVDYENDDQIGMGLAANPAAGAGSSDYLIAYSKHARNRPAQDFDVWAARLRIATPPTNYRYVPFVTWHR